MDATENDLFYHALNYRGAASQHAELFWQELQECMNRLIAEEREACAKVCDKLEEEVRKEGITSTALGFMVQDYAECAAAIRARSNAELRGAKPIGEASRSNAVLGVD